MVSAILVLALAAISLALAWSLLSRKSPACDLQGWEHKQNKIDVQILRSLFDQKENHYLQCSLPRKNFQAQVRKRIRLTLEILRVVEENTNLLIGTEQVAISNGNPELTRQRNELLAGTVQLRLNLLLARFFLCLEWLFPSWTFLLPEWIRPYAPLLHCLEQYGAPPV